MWLSVLPVFKRRMGCVLEAGCGNSQWCPSDPVPQSSDRRSYYFLIAPVARISWEWLHHLNDSPTHTQALGLVSKNSAQQRHPCPAHTHISLFPLLLSHLISVNLHPQRGQRYLHLLVHQPKVSYIGYFQLGATLFPVDQRTATPQHLFFIICHRHHPLSPVIIFWCTLLVPLIQYHNSQA